MLLNKRVLLAQPIAHGIPQLTPDIGVGFLAARLRSYGYEVSALDCVREKTNLAEFTRFVKQGGFGVVGLKLFSTDIASARDMLEAVKQVSPHSVTLLGGPHPSGSPDEVLEQIPFADYAFRGEAELGLPILLEQLEHGDCQREQLDAIPGLIFRTGEGIQANEAGYLENLDVLGIPAWDLIDPRLYEKHEKLWSFQKRKTVAPLHVVRGCPYACGFCACHTITSRIVRFRGLDLVMRELRLLYDEYGVREFQLVDDFFSANRKYVMEFCQELQRQKLDVAWCCPHGLRLDSLDAELLHVMQDAGCYGTSVGIESGSQRVLDFINKRLTKDLVRQKLELIKNETNWLVQGSFILGFPTETREEMEETVAFAVSLPLDSIIMTSFRIYKGTPLFDYLARTTGETEYSKRDAYKIEYAPEGMTVPELKKIIQHAYWRFYRKPERIATLLRYLNRPRHMLMLAGKVRRRLLGFS